VRSLESLGRAEPDVPLLVALSEPYLQAVTDDLRRAGEALADPELLSIVCAGAPAGHPLARQLLPCTAALRSVVGGTLGALNVRVAARLIERAGRDGWTTAGGHHCLKVNCPRSSRPVTNCSGRFMVSQDAALFASLLRPRQRMAYPPISKRPVVARQDALVLATGIG
jgi:hypothetical protein